MAQEQKYISIFGQILFFFKYHASDRFRVLYIGEDEHKRPIAYGLLVYDENLQPWISGGILDGHRGKGYGQDLFKFLSSDWPMDVYLEVPISNFRAHKLYTKLGFLEIGRRPYVPTSRQALKHVETIITMKKVQ
jgi:ribosomal protein S18 acetylase RimI-like enzyme